MSLISFMPCKDDQIRFPDVRVKNEILLYCVNTGIYVCAHACFIVCARSNVNFFIFLCPIGNILSPWEDGIKIIILKKKKIEIKHKQSNRVKSRGACRYPIMLAVQKLASDKRQLYSFVLLWLSHSFWLGSVGIWVIMLISHLPNMSQFYKLIWQVVKSDRLN